MVAVMIPKKATRAVFRIPTGMARKWVLCDVYSISRWLMS